MPQCRAVVAEEDRQWVPLVERGCCCSLEFCCKLQAILVVVSSMMVTPMMIVEYLRCQLVEEHGSENTFKIEFRPADCGYDEMNPHIRSGHSKVGEVIIKILLQTIAMVSAIVFLVGIRRKRPKLLLPYIRVLAVHMIFCFFALLVKACVYGMWIEAIIFVLPFGVGIPYYMWLCAYSLYRKMKLEAEDQSPPTAESSVPPPAPIYAPPPGFVIPRGYGYAVPAPRYAPPADAGVPSGIQPRVLAFMKPEDMPPGAGALPRVPPGESGFVKPEDSPPPSYEVAVGINPTHVDGPKDEPSMV